MCVCQFHIAAPALLDFLRRTDTKLYTVLPYVHYVTYWLRIGYIVQRQEAYFTGQCNVIRRQILLYFLKGRGEKKAWGGEFVHFLIF